MRSRRVLISGFSFAIFLTSFVLAAGEGVLVWQADPTGAWARAGVQKDDRVIGWSLDSNHGNGRTREGKFLTPLSLRAVEEALGGTGSFHLDLRRGHDQIRLSIPPGYWRVDCLPGLHPEEEKLRAQCREALTRGGTKGLIGKIQRIVAPLDSPGVVAWWLYQGSLLLLHEALFDEAENCFSRAVTTPGLSADLQTILEEERGAQLRRLGHLGPALRHLKRAMVLISEFKPNSLWEARIRCALARAEIQIDDIDGALTQLRLALETTRNSYPSSLAEAEIQTEFGNGLDAAGKLSPAELAYRRALELRREINPDGEGIHISLNDLGIIAAEKGNLKGAETLFQEVYLMDQEDGLESHDVLNNLSMIAVMQGEYRRAAELLNRVLQVLKKEQPEGKSTISTMNNLGIAYLEQGKLDEAEQIFREAISISKKGGHLRALHGPLHSLGDVLFEKGELDGAEKIWLEDLQGSVGLERAGTLTKLGLVASKRNHPEKAWKLHSEALEIRKQIAPGSPDEEESLAELGRVARAQGKLEKARRFFVQAIAVLDRLLGRIGTLSDDQARYRAGNMEIYRDLIDVLVRLQRSDEAYEILEKARAWSLRNQLAERELVFTADLPEDLDKERLRLETEIDRLEGFLFSGEIQDPHQIAAVKKEWDELKAQRKSVEDRIRAAAPRLSAFRDPQAITARDAQSILDSSTLVLAFSIGEQDSWLFTLSAEGPVRAYPLQTNRQKLERQIAAFRGLIEAREEISLIHKAGASLFQILLQPASSVIASKARLLIIPDGPLQILPFAALSIPEKKGWAYLVEQYSIGIVDSMSTLSLLNSGARAPASGPITVFADPLREGSDQQSLERSDSHALAGSRREAAVVRKLFGPRVRVFLGADATTAAATEVPRETGLLHFACHVRLNTRSPLDSAILLSTDTEKTPAEIPESGLLPAWEILEKIRLNGALVGLSGCQTALGARWPGEGLVGLTRAFQAAGARSVVASLWKVQDHSTAELMSTFYRRLSEGKALDDSLREAQMRCLHPEHYDQSWFSKIARWLKSASSSCEQPADWAAFTLRGAREWSGSKPEDSGSSD